MENFEDRGFAIEEAVLGSGDLDALSDKLDALQADGPVPGLRDLFASLPELKEITAGPNIRRLVEQARGPEAKPVRAIFFNKTPAFSIKRRPGIGASCGIRTW